MARKVEVTLSGPQEAALMDRYGRKCNPEGLVLRAVKEVVAMQAEDVGVFKTIAEFEAEQIARIQQSAKEFYAKQSRVPLDVRMRVSEFQVGVPLFDKDGRKVSALIITMDQEMIDQGHWLVAQFDGDNPEWFPVTPDELSVDKPSEAEQEQAFREAVGFVKPNSAPSAEYLYPYCQTCKVRCAVSHSDGDQAGIDAFLAAHPSPEHVVDPMWENEIAKSGT